MKKNRTVELMSVTERLARVTLGAAMLAPVFSPTLGEMGWYSVIVLASVYPILTAITGVDPIRAILANPLAYRAFAATTGAALIGTVFVIPAIEPVSTLGTLALLPLAGAYAVLTALLGRSLIATAAEATQAVVRIVPPPVDEDVEEPALLQAAARNAA